MKQKDDNSIKHAILAQIESGKAKMRPRWYFSLVAILTILGIGIVFLFLLYIVSFIFFVLRESGVLFVPLFGLRGVRAFLVSLPWLLILASIVFACMLELLVRRYPVAYRKPLLYSLFGIVVLVIGGTSIVSYAGWHQHLFYYAKEGKLPLAGFLYRGYGLEHFSLVHAGVITRVAKNTFAITNRQGETLLVMVSSDTVFPRGVKVKEGDVIVVLGERINGTVKAFGIRPLFHRR